MEVCVYIYDEPPLLFSAWSCGIHKVVNPLFLLGFKEGNPTSHTLFGFDWKLFRQDAV